ncbi:hypothetical protein Slin15195_G127980 [Septoria linicola]|uniref:Uncharacterized protein n=1 Tax=Septoria linicola TaxID=215465 RepID=A0A9Q9B1Z2_9PEZI|nr:hypothetical protein Slin15195_G127980 [Septoria linicola]
MTQPEICTYDQGVVRVAKALARLMTHLHEQRKDDHREDNHRKQALDILEWKGVLRQLEAQTETQESSDREASLGISVLRCDNYLLMS